MKLKFKREILNHLENLQSLTSRHLQEVRQNLKSEHYYKNYLPSVPLAKDLKDWTDFGIVDESSSDRTVDIYMRRGIFVSEVGDITGIAFLVFRGVIFL